MIVELFLTLGIAAITSRRILLLQVYQFMHQRSNARFVHIDRNDMDNAFCVAFRTPPSDRHHHIGMCSLASEYFSIFILVFFYFSTGVAHILEHTTLCGSEKYPVRYFFFAPIALSHCYI